MSGTAADRDLSIMMWTLAIIVAFVLLIAIVSATSLSDAGIAGWMAGLSTGTRVVLAAFVDA
jgi:hypothetical protein